jgi:hypothetical protein
LVLYLFFLVDDGFKIRLDLSHDDVWDD